ncbi:hypothetical protein ACFQL1_15095 [Halomicroarcula sp. GCM10025709]|uniref:hypothetical protein n=1 Tax=Halomicroarcula sp. GCM10025709 TaxID=3252669 RepID=UPI00360E5DAA
MTDTERLPYLGMAARHRFRLSTLHRLFVIAVVVFYGVGDTATTIAVLTSGGVEASAVATAALDEVGLLGLVGLKLLALSFVGVAWLFLDRVGDRLRIDAQPFQLGMLAILVVRGRGSPLGISLSWPSCTMSSVRQAWCRTRGWWRETHHCYRVVAGGRPGRLPIGGDGCPTV